MSTTKTFDDTNTGFMLIQGNFVKLISMLLMLIFCVFVSVTGAKAETQHERPASNTIEFFCDNGHKINVLRGGGMLVVLYQDKAFIQIEESIFAAGSGELLHIEAPANQLEVKHATSADNYNKNKFVERFNCQ